MGDTSACRLTISRERGSGGAYIGRQLATQLGLLYLDREILHRAAQQLQVAEETLEARDEAMTTFWQSLTRSLCYGALETLNTPVLLPMPTDRELHQAEATIITQVAQCQGVVVIGRGGAYVLQNHPNLVSVFLYASKTFRQQRIEEVYGLSAKEAAQAIETTDHDRASLYHSITGRDWHDARQYHLCLDTGVLGIEETIRVILAYVRERCAGDGKPPSCKTNL